MLTQDAVLKAVEDGTVGYDRRTCAIIDSRDYSRLVSFFPVTEVEKFGYKADPNSWTALPWTEEAVRRQLSEDLAFAFEKAINGRGISSSLMYGVVKMWLWILEDDLVNFSEYAPYGLPLYRAVAEKYGFHNPEKS